MTMVKRRIKPANKISIFAASLSILFVMSACSGISFSPEQAVISEVLRADKFSSILPDPDSVQVTQTQELNGVVFVQVAFQAKHGDNQQVEGRCLNVYKTEKTPLGFIAGSGGGGCGSGDEEVEPFEVGMGNNHSGDGAYSYVYGFVNKPEISTMEITWEDDQVDQVEVVNETYLFTRDGDHNGEQLVGLDEQDQAVHEWNRPAEQSKK